MKTVLVMLFTAFYFAVLGRDIGDSINGLSVKCECVQPSHCRNVTTDSGGDVYDSIRVNRSCGDDVPVCCSIYNIVEPCGLRHPHGVGFRIYNENESGEAEYAEFPWTVLVYHEKREPYQCDGSLIHPQVVISTAQCVNKEGRFLVRLGDWDLGSTNELFPHQDRDVKTIIKHPQFNERTLLNNIALLVLDKPAQIAAHVNVVCLPRQDMVVDESQCFSSGWSKGFFSPHILKKMKQTIVSRESCQKSLRKTLLGNDYKLDDSFICADDAPSRDVCIGDEGGPLVCPIPGRRNRYFQIGILSWGCAGERTRGVYINVAKYADWIGWELNQRAFSSLYYKY